MMRVTDQFRVRSDKGIVYNAICRQRVIDTTSLQERSERLGMPEYRLEDDRPLNFIDQDTFQIVATGERVRRIPA
jgi:hypothetical protein